MRGSEVISSREKQWGETWGKSPDHIDFFVKGGPERRPDSKRRNRRKKQVGAR